MLRHMLMSILGLDKLVSAVGIGTPNPKNLQCAPKEPHNFIEPKVNPCIFTPEGAEKCCWCIWKDSLLARNQETTLRWNEYEVDPVKYMQITNRKPPKPLKFDEVPSEDLIEAVQAHLTQEGRVLTFSMLEKNSVIRFACQLTVSDKAAQSILPWTAKRRDRVALQAARMTTRYMVLCPKPYLPVKLRLPSKRQYDDHDLRRKEPPAEVISARCMSPEELQVLSRDGPDQIELLGERSIEALESENINLMDGPDAKIHHKMWQKRMRDRETKKERDKTKKSKLLHAAGKGKILGQGSACIDILSSRGPLVEHSVPMFENPGSYWPRITTEPITSTSPRLIVAVETDSQTVEALSVAVYSKISSDTTLTMDGPSDTGRLVLDDTYMVDDALDIDGWQSANVRDQGTLYDLIPQPPGHLSLQHTTTNHQGLSITRELELIHGDRGRHVVFDTNLWNVIPGSADGGVSGLTDRLTACFVPAHIPDIASYSHTSELRVYPGGDLSDMFLPGPTARFGDHR